ncbi:MAG: PDDEXK nuclease domain-containing protein [Bifidobacteriaceae bacterium]|jgi:predicted nuclease of restriction endonuclease-like (RecB) superfamily|nr:PDDEXK nuclease domain-containing protein [Bifidobacteriaceae bacterium]
MDPTGLDYDLEFAPLIAIIETAQARAYRAVNRELISMYWQVGEYISAKATTEAWGQGVVQAFSRYVQERRPSLRGFSPQNVWRMKQFYEAYAGNDRLAALPRQTTWTNNLHIMAGAKTDEAREFYLILAARYHYSEAELVRQIDSALFERTMLSGSRTKHTVARHPQLAVLRDSYAMEWLELPSQHRESDLRRSIVAHLRDFMLEFGGDFSFIGQEFRVQVGMTDGYIDLIFHHRELTCLVAVELKLGRFRPEHLGRPDLYLEALDRDVRKPNENPSVGLILCTAKDDAVVEYTMSRSLSPAMVAEYQVHLPDRAVLEVKLRELARVAAFEMGEDDYYKEGADD